MPSAAVKSVITPSEKGTTDFILNQKIDVDDRGDPADEEKDILGEAPVRVTDSRLQAEDGGSIIHKTH
ncbi:MAG: hypothetical protein ABSB35_09550 [Bryobacteraceae bacterium]|jgi:hypothetical protein